MIPSNISSEHIIQAIGRVDRDGIPPGRTSRKYQLIYNGNAYPPKYIISCANYYANGEEHPSDLFGGGNESNGFLRTLGFTVADMSGQVTLPKKTAVPTIDPQSDSHNKPRIQLKNCESTRHTERCPECKTAVKNMLSEIYGEVIKEYPIQVETNPEKYSENKHTECLRAIHAKLADFRGHDGFAKAKTLSVDYFVPSENLIVEFDESQHFTNARKITLDSYPESLNTGYSLDRWKGLCLSLNKHDNDPPYRDEQRAWYDTVRDFYPSENGLNPLVRLYAGEMRWCTLNPENRDDVEYFKNRILNKSETDGIYPLIEQFNSQLNTLKFRYYDWARGRIENDGIGWCHNRATTEFMGQPISDKAYLCSLLKQIIGEINTIPDLSKRYEIIREVYCTHPSLHEIWFFDDHFSNFFTGRTGAMKHRSGLHSVLTSLKKGTFDMTRKKTVSTILTKQTILLENMFSGSLPYSLMDAEVLSEENLIAEIRGLSDIANHPTPDEIISVMPSVLDVTRTILEMSDFHPLKRMTILSEGSFLFYAPCAINEGPLFTKKSSLKGTEILHKITDYRQENIRECLMEHYDIIPVRKD